ncbi:MAG: NADH-quinone oxidoreductase subunit N [Deltaproteobacteria bacterium]|nr:NADH-quinone oxidoreductase subunit N [Deltaproteobacteria bacterium]
MKFDIINILASMPEIIVISSACLLLVVDLFLRKGRKHIIAYLSLIVIVLAAAVTWWPEGNAIHVFNRMFVVDSFSTFFKILFYLSTALTILFSINYVKIEGIEHGEYYILMLFALSGMMIMASATDLLSIYISLELMAISVYVLTGFMRGAVRSNEAAMKYVILGAISSGILIYGISLIYGLTGTTQIKDIAGALRGQTSIDPGLILAIIFLVAGFGFKVAAVPFHMWAPDVYEGAPTSITAFMSVGPKAAAFAVFLRVFMDALAPVASSWITIMAVISVLTMALGSFIALVQTNIKRMLAYSSIAHAGYGLLGFVAGGRDGIAGVMLYMLIYTFMNIGIFCAIIVMRKGDFIGENIEDYTGLAKVNKGMALLMLIFLFSLAGIPPTAGFVGKFYIFMALIHKGFITLAVIAVLMSAVSAYFYIRIVMLMYMKDPVQEFDLAHTSATRLALAIAVFGTIIIGILPAWFIDMAQRAVLR